MPPEEFAELMGRLGVADDTTVITYDDNNSLLATRLWWVLQYSVTQRQSLNGGWHKWLSEKRPIATHATRPEPARFTARTNLDAVCTLDRLKDAVGSPGVGILDVRSDEEFAGTNSRGNRRAGTFRVRSTSSGWISLRRMIGESSSRPPRFEQCSKGRVFTPSRRSSPTDREASVRRTECSSSPCSASTASATMTARCAIGPIARTLRSPLNN